MKNATNLVDEIILDADIKRASDIHMDPNKSGGIIRYRIDGILIKQKDTSSEIFADMIGRLKVIAGMRTDEHQAPQDGRFKSTVEDTEIDIRLAIMPSFWGESATLRLLRPSHDCENIDGLGLKFEDIEKIKSVMRSMSGMIIVTGPTGSGKTTTLYTILRHINVSENSVMTIEDPIEYSLPGIRQTQTNPQRGLSFSLALRSILRQDPDVIMIGEIRDKETAQIAVHAALTGHMVLTTLHTNDASTAIPRLLDMGIDPYLVASVSGVVIGQRLVRKRCDCIYGCDKCEKTGYKGRLGIFEVIKITEDIQRLTLSKPTAKEIKNLAFPSNIGTMESDGLEKVEKGLTSIEEVVSAVTI